MSKVEGFGQSFTLTGEVLKKGVEWNEKGGFVKQAAAHTLIPVSVVAAAAIDLVAHAFLAVGKTVGFAVNAVLWTVTVGYVSINASLMPSQILLHAWKTAMSVAIGVTAPVFTIFSASAALQLARAVGLVASDAPQGWWRGFVDNMPAGWKLAKVSYVGKELFKGGVDLTKATAEGVKHHAWDRWEHHKVARIAVPATFALVYLGLVWHVGAGFAAPANKGLELAALPVTVGYGYAKTAAAYTWSYVPSVPAWVPYFGKVDLTATAAAAKTAKDAACTAAEVAQKAAAAAETDAALKTAATAAAETCDKATATFAAATKAVDDAAAEVVAKAAAEATAKAAADEAAKIAADKVAAQLAADAAANAQANAEAAKAAKKGATA